MCGIAGIATNSGVDISRIVRGMADTMAARGPDDRGDWKDPRGQIAFGHRRLSILDLSERGHQPMVSRSGRYVVTYNGEIFNFSEIRQELQQHGHIFNGGSDTEVLLAASEQWGVLGAVQRFNGMFAYGIYDRDEEKIWLVRDRVGEKPLYFGYNAGAFLFASELKSFWAYPNFSPEISAAAATSFVAYGYVPAPLSIYEGIQKVKPGHLVSIDCKSLFKFDHGCALSPAARQEVIEEVCYWDLVQFARDVPIRATAAEGRPTLSAVETLLTDAIRARMISDRPIGAFLSGGIDSSTIAALMQSISTKPIMTFCIGYEEPRYDESLYAKRVSFHLGTDHYQLIISANDALNVIPDLPQVYDEPFADASQIPTLILSKLVKKHVCVALSGDGGDELFGGYVRHRWTERLVKFNSLGFGITGAAAKLLIESFSPQRWDEWYPSLRNLVPLLPKMHAPGHYAYKFASLFGARDVMDMYSRLTRLWEPTLMKYPRGTSCIAESEGFLKWKGTDTERMLMLDTLTYLPDDIMVKVDRASMSQSLEVRSPYLDHRLLELAWSIPINSRISFREPKHILRSIAHKYLPQGIFNRPKAGFGIPIDSWLRGPLREWAQNLLDPTSLNSSGLFNVEPIQQRWQEHLSGRRNWQYHIWNILMFEAWRRTDFRNIYSGVQDLKMVSDDV